MNPDIKTRWVAALKSGDYKQGRSYLHHVKEDTYCCLGVLCEIAVADGVIQRIDETYTTAYGTDGDMGHSILPSAVVDWAGLESSNPNLGQADGRDVVVSYWNDFAMAGFDAIAKLIEEHL